MTIEPYNGKCPMCSGQLLVIYDWLVCENGDYKTARAWFENAWDAYDKLANKTDEAVEALLHELQLLNHSDYVKKRIDI